MEKTVMLAIGVSVIVILLILFIVIRKREHYDGTLPVWNWTTLDKKGPQPKNRCIAKPGKYFTPGL